MIDSSGIGVLVAPSLRLSSMAARSKTGQSFQVALQTLKIVGLLSLFELFDDDTKAIQSFN